MDHIHDMKAEDKKLMSEMLKDRDEQVLKLQKENEDLIKANQNLARTNGVLRESNTQLRNELQVFKDFHNLA